MKVKVLLNLGTGQYPDNPLQAGEHDVSDDFGTLLISRGHAIQQKAEVKVVEAKPDKFETMRRGHRKSESSSE